VRGHNKKEIKNLRFAVEDLIVYHIYPYPPIMRNFFFLKLTFKFPMRIIHGSHCLPKFSLAYDKQKLPTNWFSITLIKQTTNKECVISILESRKCGVLR